ncbi:high-affinity nickel-transport protein-domain-containing protein [Schizophyllum fasciatum]
MVGLVTNLGASAHKLAFWRRLPRLTLLGRSLLLVACELLVNAVFWAVAGILFGKHDTRSILGLALLAWTLGLRHALDADHISAIDNATRGLISMGQLPVTCGLFFSLGHSTIVIVVNVAIAISTDVYQHIDGVGSVGGIATHTAAGAAVSGSFLFIVGLANSIILYKILQRRREFKKRQAQAAITGEDALADFDSDPKHSQMFMMRILGPVLTFVDRPWKMYPVGVLFGFGFDTASSIALLAVSAIGKKGANNETIPTGYIVILPLLFTAGMTFIDSLDSILMLYSYSGFPEHSWKILESRTTAEADDRQTPPSLVRSNSSSPLQSGSQAAPYGTDAALGEDPLKSSKASAKLRSDDPDAIDTVSLVDAVAYERKMRAMRVKANMMSGLSIILTLMSILVAFSISLITIMGLIGDNCGPCQDAAEAEDGGGLAGRWWRGWARANDNSGYIGAGIVGAFIVVVASWFGGRRLIQRWRKRREDAVVPPPRTD